MQNNQRRVTQAIILAGGLGTRLREIVADVPKPMAPINGRPFLEYQLDYWIGQGIRRFILSVGYKRDIIINHFGHKYRDADIDYAIEETPLGTGGGILLAAQKLSPDRDFLILNGDTFFEVDLATLQQAHHNGCTLALFTAAEANRYGKITQGEDGRITAFSTEKAAEGAPANGGVYLLSPGVLSGFSAGIPLSFEADILPALLARGVVCYGISFPGRFFDIGLPHDYHQASHLIC